MDILRCMDSKFCVKFQRAPLKFHTKFWTHTPQNMHYTVFNFCVWVTISLNCDVISLSETGPWWLSWGMRNYILYVDVILTTMASQITSLTVVYWAVYSDADQSKHQSSASLAFVWGIHQDRWIPRTKGQLRGKCFHLMTSSCLQSCRTSRQSFRRLRYP